MSKLIDTLLLLALPASGRSEVRRYLSTLTPETCADDFSLGATVQLDDFPYIHFMRRIDESLGELRWPALFFQSAEQSFQDPLEWGTLIELVNEDFSELIQGSAAMPPSAAYYLMFRLEQARRRVGGPPKLSNLPPEIQEELAQKLEAEAVALQQNKYAEFPDSLENRTIVLEFARGGSAGSQPPLPAPFGYQYALSVLSDEILQRAAILYLWVTPEESRRKNVARANPDDPGSIPHHGVPEEVMRRDYGCDDMEYLIRRSDQPDTIRLETHGKTYHLPVAVFDNRVDKTSFICEDPRAWKKIDVEAMGQGLKEAFAKLRRQAESIPLRSR
jgi:hypothetical protein